MFNQTTDHTHAAPASQQLSYWQSLTGRHPQDFSFFQLPPVLQQQDMGKASFTWRFDPLLAKQVKRLANDSDTGILVVFSTAIALLLSRYCGREQVLISTPFYNTAIADKVERLVPLHLHMRHDAALKACLDHTKEVVKQSYMAQQELSQGTLSLPATNILLYYPPVHVDWMPEVNGLQITLQQADDTFELQLQYLAGAYHAAFIGRIGKQLETVLQQLFVPGATAGSIVLMDLPLPGEQFHLTESEASIISVFEENVKRWPQQIAIVADGITLTYEELDAQVNVLTMHLQQQVQPGGLVALMVDKRKDLVVGMLAIMKSGAAYLPVDPAAPEGRRSLLLAEKQVKLLVTVLDHMFGAADFAGPILAMDQLDYSSSISYTATNISPDALAYVIYTSGSTGIPRGVMVSHRNCLNTVMDHIARLGITPADKVLQAAAISFDVSVCEILLALLAGATLIGTSPQLLQNPAWLVAHMEEKDVTVALLTSAYFQWLDPARLPALRVLVTGGETPLFEHAAAFARRLDYYNAYGPTECSICSTIYKLEAASMPAGIVPIGKPVNNTRVYLLDRLQQAVPVGIMGEIYISGAGVSQGYLSAPELTAAQFLPDPFHPGKVMYRSGDMALQLEDGNLLFLGREDDQLKINGMRISPEEINQVLEKHPAVAAAVTYPLQPGESQSPLAVAIRLQKEPAFTLGRMLQLREKSPEIYNRQYLLPNGLVVLPANNAEATLLYEEIFAERCYLQEGIHLLPGDVVFDIGANIGMFSLWAACTYENIKVFAFEPVAAIYEMLEANVHLYDIDVRTFNIGLSDQAGTVMFNYYPNNTALSGMYGDAGQEALVKNSILEQSAREGIVLGTAQLEDLVKDKLLVLPVSCKLDTLSSVINEHGITRIDLLKIDAEHNEHRILAGIGDNDWTIIKQVVMEVHGDAAERLALRDLLESKGFTVREIFPDETSSIELSMMYCTREDVLRPALPTAKDKLKYRADFAALAQEIKQHAGKYLQPAFIPAEIKFLDVLPLTANGKTDFVKLRNTAGMLVRDQAICLPRNETEAHLLQLWKAILQVPDISVFDNFFDRGGNSLKVIRLFEMLRTPYPGRISVADLFDLPTIAQQASRLQPPSPGDTTPAQHVEVLSL